MNSHSLAPLFGRKKTTFYARFVKRPLDFCAALIALIVLLPLLLLIAVLLIIVQGGNPFFLQTRLGRNCKPFRIIKFCTMSNERGADGELLPDEERTSWLGKMLRAASLDELPELLNVLKGDMSFIGPRPWIPEQMATFTSSTQKHRMRVRPGISGLAQILGRNDLTFRQRVSFDLRYNRNINAWLDFRILFYTIYKVALREGIYQHPNALGKAPHPTAPKDPATRGQRGNKPRRKVVA